MRLINLWNKSMLILGFGIEGESTYRFLRSLYPRHVIGIADDKLFEQLSLESQDELPSDRFLRLHLGREYLSSLDLYDVVIKESRIDLTESETEHLLTLGKTITSQPEIFFSNCPGKIVGITNSNATKDTANIIHKSLISARFDSYLVGNTSLHLLKRARTRTVFIFNMRIHTLKGFKQSPHIAVILNHAGKLEGAEVLEAYHNLVMHQLPSDYLIHNPLDHAAQQMASKSKGTRIHYSSDITLAEGCFIDGHLLKYRTKTEQELIRLDDIRSQGSHELNYDDLLPSVIVCRILGVEWPFIADALKNIGCLS